MIEINTLKTILNTFEELEFTYLFSSYATHKTDKHSDIDIVIFVKQAYNLFDTKLTVHHRLEITLNKEVNVVVLNSIKNFDLLNDILDYGVLLKDSKNDFRVIFEPKKQHEILDYKESKRMLNVA